MGLVLNRIGLAVFGSCLLMAAIVRASTGPDAPTALLDQGLQAYTQGRYSEAVSFYQNALDHRQGNAQAYYGEGLVCMKLRLWKRAEESFRNALAENASDPKLWMGLGWAQQKQGHRVEAAISFQKIFQLPSSVQDRTIAGKHLAQLGAEVPVPVSSEDRVVASFDGAWKPQLTLQVGGSTDDDLDRAPTASLNSAVSPLSDGAADLAARFDLTKNFTSDSHFDLDAAYARQSYFTDTNFDDQTLTGKAAYTMGFFPWLQGKGQVEGDSFTQTEGIDYYSGSGSVELKARLSSLRVSASYCFSLEQYTDYTVPTNPVLSLLGNPSDTNSKVEVRAYENIFPWLVLNGEYQYKNNNADSLGYEYTLNGVGGGLEVFLFTGDRLLTGLQLNYLYQFSVSPGSMTVIYQETLFRTNQQNNVNIFSANLDVPLSAQWSMNAFYRYVDDQCNFPFFSYSDHNMGLNLSWALL